MDVPRKGLSRKAHIEGVADAILALRTAKGEVHQDNQTWASAIAYLELFLQVVRDDK